MADSQRQIVELVNANNGGKLWPLLLSIFITFIFTVAARVSPARAMSGHMVKIRRKNRRQKKIHSFEAFYARLNMQRNKGRTAAVTCYRAGDIVLINHQELEVLAVSDQAMTLDNEGFTNGLQIIVFDPVYNEIVQESNYTEIYVSLSSGADREMIESKIEQICSVTAGGRWLSYQETDQQLEESYRQIKFLVWSIIAFIGLIGILNIINTVYTNIHIRLNEIGIQRAIGMNRKSFYKVFLWEGAYYGMAAAAIGSTLGYLCTVFVEAAANDIMQLVPFPIVPVAQASFIFIGACLIATILPLSRVFKMNIVECIESVE